MTDDTEAALEALAIEAGTELVDDMHIDEDEAVELLAHALDAIIDAIPDPAGAMVDLVIDEDRLARAIVELLKPDPDRIEDRADKAAMKGKDNRAARLYARAARVRARQGGSDV